MGKRRISFDSLPEVAEEIQRLRTGGYQPVEIRRPGAGQTERATSPGSQQSCSRLGNSGFWAAVSASHPCDEQPVGFFNGWG
jgi:hypothetical protein